MHDIRLIRENPEAFDAGLARRGLEPLAQALLALDAQRRAVATRMQEAQNRRNEASKAIGAAKAQKRDEEAAALMTEVAELKQTLPALEEEERALDARQRDELSRLPQIPVAEVPDGEDEAGNVEVSRWGTLRSFDFAPKEHADLGPALGLDFETGAAISGARFTFLRGQMARLARALGQFMLDRQTADHGYTECAPPLLVRDEAVFGTGQLPKFEEDLFRTTDGRWLIPTAEVSLTNSVREQILPETALPLRMTALTPCFRSEAGSAGKDTRGYIRQHQFDKVELVAVCRPEESEAEHEKMATAAESILQALELPYRKMLLCAGDMGFTAKKTFDLEVWLPGQNAYREISSISNCGDFQARRMNARYRPEAGADGKKGGTEFVHTLNGSGLAVGRTLVAVLENYQQADGSVDVPAALQPYMGGLERLTPGG
ncbi:serine--tRNA ligase [Novosphingobium sp. G106]|uniref:serine--tRNA ligase n=1 Tax=Novosphingobium sp. G106 TaxID=2849500 RepID=UPI001C2D6487|nr:serine--tRNA ligase [Novosphingobium sp. G106]MBV1688668.1 serine--tRNA ligase [Novosphingobium sp. G106]